MKTAEAGRHWMRLLAADAAIAGIPQFHGVRLECRLRIEQRGQHERNATRS
jgi:hypothetical protein